MKEANYVFSALEEPDVEALMRIGTQKQLHVSDQLLTEGTYHDAIYLVLDGELSVSVKGRNAVIAYVGEGEIVGEMSLLESQPASATLCAITPVTVLRIPRDALEENLAADPGFSVRFYRALAMLLPSPSRDARSGKGIPGRYRRRACCSSCPPAQRRNVCAGADGRRSHAERPLLYT